MGKRSIMDIVGLINLAALLLTQLTTIASMLLGYLTLNGKTDIPLIFGAFLFLFGGYSTVHVSRSALRS